MSSRLKAMKELNLRYFSSLTDKQKTTTMNNLKVVKNKLEHLDLNLALQILRNRCISEMMEENSYIQGKLKGSKCFWSEEFSCHMPLNVIEIIKSN